MDMALLGHCTKPHQFFLSGIMPLAILLSTELVILSFSTIDVFPKELTFKLQYLVAVNNYYNTGMQRINSTVESNQ